MGKKTRGETSRGRSKSKGSAGAAGPEPCALTRAQQDWLRRVAAIRPEGLVVEDARALPAIRTLHEKELIRRAGTEMRTCYLTIAGAKCVVSLLGRRRKRAHGTGEVTTASAVKGLVAPMDGATVGGQVPVKGDAVLVDGFGTAPGCVMYVDSGKACVCMKMIDGRMSTDADLDDLVVVPGVVPCNCRDCPKLPRPKP